MLAAGMASVTIAAANAILALIFSPASMSYPNSAQRDITKLGEFSATALFSGP